MSNTKPVKKHKIISTMQFYTMLEQQNWSRTATAKALGISSWGCRKRVERLKLRGVHVPDFEYDKVQK